MTPRPAGTRVGRSWAAFDLRYLADRVLLGLTVVSTGEGIAAEFDNVEAAADVPMGGNLGGLANYGGFHPFKDLVRGGFADPFRLDDNGAEDRSARNAARTAGRWKISALTACICNGWKTWVADGSC